MNRPSRKRSKSAAAATATQRTPTDPSSTPENSAAGNSSQAVPASKQAADASTKSDGKPKLSRRERAKVERKRREEEFKKLPPIEQRTRLFRVAAGRETIEAFVVAFVLALLFRAFLAEAFVIPTGSMAPTLMGAHKDITCEECQCQFRLGASRERSGGQMRKAVVAGVCPNCRKLNVLDLAGNSDHRTFNGDRIAVNKFTYALGDPERWDVIVFKFPGNPKQNYIKRLVGLPNETLTLDNGNVFATPKDGNGESSILRKPPEIQLATAHLVSDTQYQSKTLIDAGYPSRWQPWQLGADSPPKDSWKIERDEEGFLATLEGNGQPQWLRYYHRWPNDLQWDMAHNGESLANVDPYRSRAITDFYAYNSEMKVTAGKVYSQAPSAKPQSEGYLPRLFERVGMMFNGGFTHGTFSEDYVSGGDITQFGSVENYYDHDPNAVLQGRDGYHWVGELAVQAGFESAANAKSMTLELVRGGIQFQCRVDLSSGVATLAMIDGGTELKFPGGTPTAQTPIRAGRWHDVRLTNFDDQLVLWVDDDVMTFDQPTTYDFAAFRAGSADRPYWNSQHPLDAAPVGVAFDGDARIHALRVLRDQYYIPAKSTAGMSISGYRYGVNMMEMQERFGQYESWDRQDWDIRKVVQFELEDGQYFPMGDNSPGSQDARSWAGVKPRLPWRDELIRDAWRWDNVSYVPRELFVGKAIAVFWPHAWPRGIPVPNVQRMKFIR
ncbi:MAG: S26 family signal peptidase [Planctomycetota bacterium]